MSFFSLKRVAMEKLAAVTINVPYKGAGNVIRQKEVAFDVYQDQEQYSLKPVLTEAERRLANLPENIDFQLQNSIPVSMKGIKDGNLHVIKDVVNKLREQHFIM